ncbi:hypothetical protein KEM48_004212 [Puccinia striiformis f. sp. tritici PST-130]|nr:hypothetical protein KEM48_004212 [Puccinia striiformis f. sp. tritici PST-130]
MRPACNRRPPITSSLGSSFFDKSSSAQQEKNFPARAPFSNELRPHIGQRFTKPRTTRPRLKPRNPTTLFKLVSFMTTSNTDLICSSRPPSRESVTCLSSLRPAAGPSSGLQGNNSPSRSRSLDQLPPAARAKAPIEEHASVTRSPRLKVNIDAPNLDTTPSDLQTSSKPVSVALQRAQSPSEQTLPYPLVSATDPTAAIEARDPPSTSFVSLGLLRDNRTQEWGKRG